MYVIAKRFTFSAAHHLDHLPEGHKCARRHGHNYTVEVQLAAETLDRAGFVVDFGELDPVKRFIDAELDHQDLNDVLGCQPSSEFLARYLYGWCQERLPPPVVERLRAVQVSETPTTWAEYRPAPAAAPPAERATAAQPLNDERGLLVAEIFGPTFQGEGPSAGQLAAFIRLSRCNLDCVWCDTPYTWDTSRYDLRAESRRMSESTVWRQVQAIPAGLVVITGGEPLLQQERLAWLVDKCRSTERRVEIETNGTVKPRPGLLAAVHQFNASPKLANSGVPAERRLHGDVIEALISSGKAIFKFVVTGPQDLEEIADLEAAYGLSPIWVMPEGTSAKRVLARMRALAEPVRQRGWNLTTRLQTLIWEDERGR